MRAIRLVAVAILFLLLGLPLAACGEVVTVSLVEGTADIPLPPGAELLKRETTKVRSPDEVQLELRYQVHGMGKDDILSFYEQEMRARRWTQDSSGNPSFFSKPASPQERVVSVGVRTEIGSDILQLGIAPAP